jgi:hypothetical protein
MELASTPTRTPTSTELLETRRGPQAGAAWGPSCVSRVGYLILNSAVMVEPSLLVIVAA